MVLYAHFTDQKSADQHFLAATILTQKTILYELFTSKRQEIWPKTERNSLSMRNKKIDKCVHLGIFSGPEMLFLARKCSNFN